MESWAFFIFLLDMYYVYLLESEQDGRYYIGHSQNLSERLAYHNSGRSIFTKHHGPWNLIAYKTYETRGEAMREENKLKRSKNREVIIKAFKKRA